MSSAGVCVGPLKWLPGRKSLEDSLPGDSLPVIAGCHAQSATQGCLQATSWELNLLQHETNLLWFESIRPFTTFTYVFNCLFFSILRRRVKEVINKSPWCPRGSLTKRSRCPRVRIAQYECHFLLRCHFFQITKRTPLEAKIAVNHSNLVGKRQTIWKWTAQTK